MDPLLYGESGYAEEYRPTWVDRKEKILFTNIVSYVAALVIRIKDYTYSILEYPTAILLQFGMS